jgi:hypothetical protein
MVNKVQSLVTCGIWWGLLIDVLGNNSGQGNPACWGPIISGTAVTLAFTHLVCLARMRS